MKVLLVQSVAGLGLPGDTKDVASGYARNFLFPNHLAVGLNEPQAKAVRAQLAALRAHAHAERTMAEGTAKEWAGKQITLRGKASADGTLYAAITDRIVASKLGLDPKHITFEPVKTAGTSTATIDIGQGVTTSVTVTVEVVQ